MTDIYFPVEKIPIEDILPGYDHPSGLSHAIIIKLPDNKRRIVQFCSELYHLLPNRDIVPIFETELSKYYQIETSVKMDRWARFYIDFLLKDKLINIQDGDPIFPRVRLANSYDGSVRFHYELGFFRLLCTNGMTVPVGDSVRKIVSMHTPKLGEETSFEKVFQLTSEFVAERLNISEIYVELQNQPVRDIHSRVEEIIDNTSFPIKLHEDVLSRVEQEVAALPGIKPNDWLVYGGFNYQLNHGDDFKAKEAKKNDIDLEVLDYLIKY